jgi:DNA-binding beta-propeller fold protein YncE
MLTMFLKPHPSRWESPLFFLALFATTAVVSSCTTTIRDPSTFEEQTGDVDEDSGNTNSTTSSDDHSSTAGTGEESEESEDPAESSDDPGTSTPEETNELPDLKFDLEIPDLPEDGCPGDEFEFSIIWIANSGEGTVSKIDTRTAVELARYRTGPRVDADPSRTSVNLAGAVAVANRTGSVTVIAARKELCVDKNGDGMITTSTGAANVLPWGEDECVLWHHDLDWHPTVTTDNQGGPRALAWEPGVADPNDECAPRKPRLWVGYRDDKDLTIAKIRRIAHDGSSFEEVEVPQWACNWSHGIYGGASDQEGNFFGVGSLGDVVRVDAETMELKRWKFDQGNVYLFYGMAIDSDAKLWIASYMRGAVIQFDPATEKFTTYEKVAEGGLVLRGLNVDRDGKLWVAANEPCGLGEFDTISKKWVNGLRELPECLEPVGVSIDADGNPWIVDRGAERAYRFDKMTGMSVQVKGLKVPYTYSDMTGYGLNLVDDPPK